MMLQPSSPRSGESSTQIGASCADAVLGVSVETGSLQLRTRRMACSSLGILFAGEDDESPGLRPTVLE
jgi:hypothetical protein